MMLLESPIDVIASRHCFSAFTSAKVTYNRVPVLYENLQIYHLTTLWSPGVVAYHPDSASASLAYLKDACKGDGAYALVDCLLRQLGSNLLGVDVLQHLKVVEHIEYHGTDRHLDHPSLEVAAAAAVIYQFAAPLVP
ncbi:hypothetical protein LIER_09369 [Lithospermum erythrorhizon]|uniref:Uncharacterized protein n=1 Tax=Lithospermum erythrorhizon TaxID=34254 RepID=A0AAV3PHM9_LITER